MHIQIHYMYVQMACSMYTRSIGIYSRNGYKAEKGPRQGTGGLPFAFPNSKCFFVKLLNRKRAKHKSKKECGWKNQIPYENGIGSNALQ